METLTFLFTDIEGSTALLTRLGDAAYGTALEQHHAIIRSSLATFGGVEQGTQGDSFFAVFTSPSACVAAALDMQRQLQAATWPANELLRIRTGIHTGEASGRSTGMVGYEVHRAARIAAVGAGGQVLVSSSTRALVQDSLPAGATLLDLGDHRLKDLGRPETIYQLSADDLEESFPPLRSLDSAEMPSNLPVQLTSFVGRDEALAEIATMLGEHRLVTIIGAGGVGKTRLALHVAAELLTSSPDGAWLAELASVEDEDGMVEVIARAVGVTKRADTSLTESILDSLRTRRLLLVVDNCEHLLAQAADLVEAVTHRCPNVRVLATSREGLGVDGERVWPLRSLVTPASTDSAEVFASSAAVQLLVDRATAVVPDFRLTDANAPAIGEICRRLDGIPLAIELATARMAAMQPKEVAERLDERFRLLTGGRRRGIERHQTLRAMVDWSYSLLDERERTTFERLGVFAGSFDVIAAQSVASDDDLDRFEVLDSLNELVAKSMVVAEPGPEGSTRYLLLETLRQFAMEHLDEAGAGDRFRRHHAGHYSEFIELAAPAMYGPDELIWRSRIGTEIDNLRSAVTWSLDRDEAADAEYAMRIIGALMVESVRNHGAGIGPWAERAVSHPATGDSPHRNSVLVAAANGALERLDSDAADAYLDQITDSVDDIISLASAAGIRATLTLARGDLAAADQIARDAFEALGHTKEDHVSRATLIIAPVFATLNGNIDQAEAMADDAVRASQALGQPSGLAFAYYARGFVLSYGRGDHETAIALLTESIDLTHAGASDAVYPHALMAVARAQVVTGHAGPAIPSLKLALAHGYRVGDMSATASALAYLIWAFGQLEKDENAATFAGATLAGTLHMIYVDPPITAMIDTLRERLGSARFEQASSPGAAMSYDEIVTFAMNACDDILSADVTASDGE